MRTNTTRSIADIYQSFQRSIPARTQPQKHPLLSILREAIHSPQSKIKDFFVRDKKLFIKSDSLALKTNIQLNRYQMVKMINKRLANANDEKLLIEDIFCL